MKKLVLIGLVLLVAATASQAQDFKPFKVGVGLGFAVPNRGEGGGLFYLEPAYRPSDNTLVGLRLESAIMSKEIDINGNDVRGDAKANTSYTINGQYYFNENYVRPFVGLGLGAFRLGNVRYNEGDEVVTTSGTTLFGFYPRVGLDIGHFNLIVDYNILPNTDVVGGSEVRNSYIGLRAGFSIGGGVGVKQN